MSTEPSSTYEDLQEERKEVIQALLELDCFPVGMELFPAADEDQWTFIKSVIDDCDYYILILAGRYGSCNEDGMSFTEMEYRYALEKGKPIIAFLHENPGNITANKTENKQTNKDKLEEFKTLVKKKLCKSWNSPAELGGRVSRAISHLKKNSPAIGWVKANLVPEEDYSKEILKYKKQIEELEERLGRAITAIPENTESLAQGEEKLSIHLNYDGPESKIILVEISWREIFSLLSPYLIDKQKEDILKNIWLEFLISRSGVKHIITDDFQAYRCSFLEHEFQIIKIQLIALEFIEVAHVGYEMFWKLTPHGAKIIFKLVAKKRDTNP